MSLTSNDSNSLLSPTPLPPPPRPSSATRSLDNKQLSITLGNPVSERPIPNTPMSPSSNNLTVLEEIDLTFGAAKTKQDVINALEHCKVLHRIPLTNPNVSLEQAEKDFYRERILLNDVAFIPDKNDLDRSHAFSLTLKVYLQRLMRNTECYAVEKYKDASSVAEILMQRACRTSAGADSFFCVQKMLCTEGTFVTQKTFLDDPPVHIDVFFANPTGDTHTTMDEITGIEGQDPQPWLDVDTVVIDESNFKEGKHWRRLHLIVTCPETGAVYSSADDVVGEERISGRLSSRKILSELTSWFTGNSPSKPNSISGNSHVKGNGSLSPPTQSLSGVALSDTSSMTPRSSTRML